MFLKYLALGFFVKVLTGLDDTIMHIPVLASITRTRMGKIAFSLGILLAIICAIFVAIFFASVIKQFSFARYIAGFFIFGLAALIYCDGFLAKPRKQAEHKLMKYKKISAQRFTKLLVIGFIAALATVIDDIVAYAPLFLANDVTMYYASAGILLATLMEIWIVIYASHYVTAFKYKKEVAVSGLLLLGVITITGVI